MIIGLCGYARSGKDSLATALAGTFDFQRYAFADQLKVLALETDPWVEVPYQGHRRLTYVVKDFGWDRAKDVPDVREFLQRLGTGVRCHLHEDAWLDFVVNQIATDQPEHAVITDVRFANEAGWVRRVGHLVRVVRPGVGPVNANERASEAVFRKVMEITGVVTFDNDATLTDLGPKAVALVNTLQEAA